MPTGRRTALASLQPRRICIIKPSALGDVVQTLPILTLLRRRFPQASLAWVVKQPLADLLQGHPDLEHVIELPCPRGRAARLRAYLQVVTQLRQARFDLAIDMQGLLRSAALARLAGVPRRLGMNSAREGAPWLYTDVVAVDRRQLPAAETYRRVVAELCGQTLEGPGEWPAPLVPLRAEHHDWAKQRLCELPRPWLAIHPGAAWETKRWRPAHFAEIARRAQAEGAGVVLLGGGDDRPRCDAIAAETDPRTLLRLDGRTRLLELAAVLDACDVLLAGDTGPMHLAAALQTPVVSLFTCTDPHRAGPLSIAGARPHAIVRTEVPCAASYLKRCGSLACMDELSPARVWPAVRTALAGATRSATATEGRAKSA